MDTFTYNKPQNKTRLYRDMMSSADMKYVYMAQRFPRLCAAMQWCGIMSDSEVGCALRDYVYARDGFIPREMLHYGGGEACQRYGGPQLLIRDAIRLHHRCAREGWLETINFLLGH